MQVEAPPTLPPSPPQAPIQLCATPGKAYMTMDELFEKFPGKIKKKSPGTIQENASSSALRQANITSYFKPAGQPNLTLASSTKSAVSTIAPNSAPAKPFPANYIVKTPQTANYAPKHHAIAHRPSHICRFCHETFTSNNALHRHLRSTHPAPSLNQHPEKRHTALHDHKAPTVPAMTKSFKSARYFGPEISAVQPYTVASRQHSKPSLIFVGMAPSTNNPWRRAS